MKIKELRAELCRLENRITVTNNRIKKLIRVIDKEKITDDGLVIKK